MHDLNAMDCHAEDAPRFAPDERRLLLSTPGIGPGVIQRLESAGIHSLAQIRALGVQGTVRHVCEQLGTMAWANRRGALDRALAHVLPPGRA